MNKRKTEIIGLLLVLVSFLLYAAAAYGIVRGSMKYQPERIWEGYYPVLLPQSEEKTEMKQKLAAAFPLLSRENISIRYFDFSGMAELSLPDVEKRFSAIDSRLDPFMLELENYFSSRDGKYEIVYCKSDKNPLRLYRELQRLFEGHSDSWILAGTNWTLRAVLSGFFLLLTATALFVTRKHRILIPLFGLPWMPLIFFGPIQMIMIASALFYAAVLSGTYLPAVVREYLNLGKCLTTKSLVCLCTVLWVLGLLLSLFIIRSAALSANGVVHLAYAVCASFAVEIFIIGLVAGKHAKQIHTLFFHIPLANGRRIKLQFIRLLPVPVIMGLVIIIPLFVSRLSPEVDTGIPQPSGPRYGHINYSMLSQFDVESSDGDDYLPGIEDFFKHRLFQQGWLYNIPYELPMPGRNYTISTFLLDEEEGAGGIRKEQKTVLHISDGWYQYEIDGGNGIINLLQQQGGWSQIRYKKTRQEPFKRTEIIVYFTAWFALQLSGLFSFTHLTPITLYGNKAVELRRQCQAA